jgi:hypothetical protein
MSTETSLAFHPLTILDDPPDIMVGRADIESYATFPEDGVALLKQLQAGMSPQAAEAWYQEQFGEPLDLADFIETLRDLQFLQEEGEEAGIVLAPSAFWQWMGRAAFSPLAWLLYGAIMSLCLYLMLRFPYLRPVANNIFFTPYVSLLELGLFFGQFPGILFHESFHVLAGLRLGIPSRLSIGRRFYFLVFETHLNGLWNVPRQRRYLPFLAGMLGDVLWFSLMTILASLTFPSSFGAFLRAMALLTTLRLIWQFYFYLQTDLYYVFTNALRCVNLQQTTRQFILNYFYRLIGRQSRIVDEEQWNPRDRQVARWYVPFFLGGYLFSTATFLFVGVPITFQFLHLLIIQMFNNAVFTPSFWNITIFLALNGLQLGLIIYLIIKERWQPWVQARERKLSDLDDDDDDDDSDDSEPSQIEVNGA